MGRDNGFLTPTQRRLLDVLADGRQHTAEELRTCLGDEMGDPALLRNTIAIMRRRLRPTGYDVTVWRTDNVVAYCLVRLLASPYDGKR